MTRLIQTCTAICLSAMLLLGMGMVTPALSAPVLANGDFEDNPPPSMGDNIGTAPSNWIIPFGQFNVIKVDGAGPFIYNPSYPALDQDATNPGPVDQHYLDVSGGDGLFYQVFTPLCSGPVTYGAAFSALQGYNATSSLSILRDSDGSTAAPSQSTSTVGGNTAANPWSYFSFSANLTAGIAYRFVAKINDWSVMDNAFVEFETDCPAHADASITKVCAPASLNPDGTVAISCDITINARPLGAGTTDLNDAFTMGGNAVTGVTAVVTSTDPWVCDPTAFLSLPAPICTIDNLQFPASGTSTVNVALTLPAGTTGTAENCARMRHDAMTEGDDTPVDCVEIVLPDPVDVVAPQLCTAFTPEISCDTETGTPVVTLTNTLAGQFDPTDISITSQTSGVTLLQSSPNALSYGLQGAQAGQTITLWAEAIAKGGGSAAGLDTCCMGEISVQIPQDFICEPPVVLDVTKTCQDVDGPVRMQRCTIDVQYSGPPPSPPLTVTDTLSGAGAVLTGAPTSTDNWACSGTAPASCTIDAASDPLIDWRNFNSTLVFDVRYQDGFANCAKVAAIGAQDEACYSSAEPDLTITKTANQAQCTVGQPCDFTITVTNPSAINFSGPITLTDAVVSNPYGQYTSISPPLCTVADIGGGTCAGNASIPAGGTQAYTVTWIPAQHPMAAGGEYSITNCAGVSSAGGVAGYQLGQNDTIGDTVCATVNIFPPDLKITKTGPATCAPGALCTYDITVTNGAAPYTGAIMLYDTAPAGFNVVSVAPMPAGCGGGLPAQSFICVTQSSLPANGSQTYQMGIQGNSASATDASENCAGLFSVRPDAAVGDYSTSTEISPALHNIVSQGTLLDEACVLVSAPDDIDDLPPICGNGTVEVGEICDDANGIDGDGCSNQCTVPTTDTAGLSVDKVCAPAVAGPMGLDIACTITINANGPWPAGGINVTEVLAQNLSPNDAGALITTLTWPDVSMNLNYGPVAPSSPINIGGAPSVLPASGTTVLNATVHLANEGYIYEADNCATVQGYDGNGQAIGAPITDCTNFTPPATAKLAQSGPDLIIEKTATGPCTADINTRTFGCAFKISVRNGGAAPYQGPVVLADAFKGPAPVSDVTFAGSGLDCRRAGEGAFCLTGDASIPAGGEIFILLKTTHPETDAISFQNCPSLGTGDDPKAQAMVVQTALKMLGKYEGGIDGQIGRKSRAAIAELQTVLGLPATGEIDQTLLDGLGVPAAKPFACVTVALPPMPEPPKVCDASTILDPAGNCICAFEGMAQTSDTACQCPAGSSLVAGKGCVEDIIQPKGPSCDRASTVSKGGECVCRFKNMYQKNSGACGCVKGTKFVKGEGCLKPKVKTSTPNPTGTPKPKGLRCDPATTRAKGGKCVCATDNYLPISPTECAPERKVKRKCPAGQAFIMGMGCVDEEIYFGGSDDNDKGDPDPDPKPDPDPEPDPDPGPIAIP